MARKKKSKRPKRRQKGGFFGGILKFVENPAIQAYARMKLAKVNFKKGQRGGQYIPGTGMFKFLSSSGRRQAARTGLRDLKKDSDFIGQLFKAHLPKYFRKR